MGNIAYLKHNVNPVARERQGQVNKWQTTKK